MVHFGFTLRRQKFCLLLLWFLFIRDESEHKTGLRVTCLVVIDSSENELESCCSAPDGLGGL